MLEVTKSALTNIKDYLRQQQLDSPIRVTMISGGCAGPSLGLAVDEANGNDKTFNDDGVIFVVAESLFATFGAVKVDFIAASDDGGFKVTSEKPLTGGGCGCSCSSGSCS